MLFVCVIHFIPRGGLIRGIAAMCRVLFNSSRVGTLAPIPRIHTTITRVK